MELRLAVRHLQSTGTLWLWGGEHPYSATLCISPNDFFKTTSIRCGVVGQLQLSERTVRIKGGDRTQTILAQQSTSCNC